MGTDFDRRMPITSSTLDAVPSARAVLGARYVEELALITVIKLTVALAGSLYVRQARLHQARAFTQVAAGNQRHSGVDRSR
jgi:hypothetical protein